MINLDSARMFLRYSDWANDQILRAAVDLNDEQLDRLFDMSRGSLRKTMLHIWSGESVWVQRWQGQAETPWPDESEPLSAEAIQERFTQIYYQRAAFIASLADADLARTVTYRDSKGSRFTASLGDMMMQMILHSTHHRAQVVNMLRRVGGRPPELDYMMWVRRPA